MIVFHYLNRQILQQNHDHLLAPFNHQWAENGDSLVDPTSFLSEEQMSWIQDESRFDSNTDRNGGQTNENWADNGVSQELWQNKNATNESMVEVSEEAEQEPEKAVLAQEEFEKWLEDMDEEARDLAEKNDEVFEDYSFYLMLMLPFLIFPKVAATKVFATKLLTFIIEKLGIINDANLLFTLFVSTIDQTALAKGQFKPVENYKRDWYIEIYDYMLIQLGVNDAIRLGTQYLMPW